MPPFDWSVAYKNDQWWDDVRYYYDSECWFVQVLENGVEVARVELDDPGGLNPTYANVPVIGAEERLEIQLIEVATAVTRRGIGTRVVQGLAELHPGRWLFAYSEESDQFWASIGWDRFDHPEGQRFHRPLFIQQARQEAARSRRPLSSPMGGAHHVDSRDTNHAVQQRLPRYRPGSR